MAIERTMPESVVDLDRKVSRAMDRQRGITLTADQLDVLAAIGLIELLAEAKATILKEQARCRQAKGAYINGGNSGSTSPEEQAAGPSPATGISGGTMPPPDTSAARARAQEIFG